MDGPNIKLTLDQLEEIDRLADQFEREFQTGKNPRIEEYLPRLPHLRTNLLRQLLSLEIGLRQEAGKLLPLEQYQQRFPEDWESVESVIGSVSNETIVRPPVMADEDNKPQPQQLGP